MWELDNQIKHIKASRRVWWYISEFRKFKSCIDGVIRCRTPSPFVTMCPMLSKILCMTAMWISCNCCTAPLWLITVICKMSQGGNDSHHPVHPSKVLLKSNYWHPRYCVWHLYGGTFIVGDKYKCALISFSCPALLFVGFNFCYVSLRNVLSIYLLEFFRDKMAVSTNKM